jgi:UDP-N-acetylmuramate dehydrogenase
MILKKVNQPPEFIKTNCPLMSTNRITTGGNAAYFAPAATMQQLNKALTFSRENQLPFYILGNGSNVLISDENFNGVVVKLEGSFKSISFDCVNRTVTAGAGASLMKLGHNLALQGYKGFLYMGVIPGTVGGAVRMNAGTTKEEEIKNNFLSALILDPETNSIEEYNKEKMAFDYRESLLIQSKKIIIQATFQLPWEKELYQNEAINSLNELLKLRRSKQPHNPRTFGSVFKNPENSKHSAGWYLEKVGMKKTRVGGAIIAEEHANWILNADNAKTNDVKKLITTGQKRVSDEFGIELEREVIYLPEDMAEWR